MMNNEFSRRRGTTLIEALVYTVIFGLVLTCIYWVLIASMRYYSVANDSIDLQQSALNSMSTLVQDLCESQSTSIYTFTSPSGILFVSPRDSSNQYTYDAKMNLQYQKWVCYYVGTSNGVNYLYKKELTITPTADPAVVPGYATTSDFAGDSALPKRTIGKYINTLECNNASGVVTTIANFEKSPGTDKQNLLEIRNETKLRNI